MNFLFVVAVVQYSRRNSVKFPASGVSKFGDPRLMLQVGSVCEVARVCVSVFVQSEWCTCQYSSAYVA
jgi:hypothetical protein